MSPFDLSGRVAIVAGGNGGIGLGMALGMARAGAAIVVAGRNAEKNRTAIAEIEATGAKAHAIVADVTQEADCAAMVAAATDHFGRLDILVNNAGINIRKQPENYSPAEWQSIIDVNLTGAFLGCQAAYPAMVEGGGGKIINIGSMVSVLATSFAVAYAASKGGIVQMSKGLATTWAKDNIQVNAVLPGWIDSDLSRRARRDVEDLHDRVMARTPAARWGTPEDLAGIGVFLAGPASDFVTGAAIPVDGGYSAQG